MTGEAGHIRRDKKMTRRQVDELRPYRGGTQESSREEAQAYSVRESGVQSRIGAAPGTQGEDEEAV